MANYRYMQQDILPGYSDFAAGSMRIAIAQLPDLASVRLRLTATSGSVTYVSVVGTGTYSFSNTRAISIEVNPTYNDSYSAGSFVSTITAYTSTNATGPSLGSANASDTISALSSSGFPIDDVGTGGADVLNGDSAANRLIGREGDDTLNGSGGSDTMNGGTGNDTVDYSGSNAAVVVLVGGAGTGGYAQGDTLISIENITGSTFGDTITGDGSGNAIAGGDGADVMSGGGGDDALYGDGGDDIIEGGTGNDTLRGGAGLDTLRGGDDADMLQIDLAGDLVAGETYDGGAGTDLLILGYNANSDLSEVTLTGIEEINRSFFNFETRLTAAQLDAVSRVSGQSFTLTSAGAVTMSGVSINAIVFTLSNLGNTFDLTGSIHSSLLTVNGGAGNDTIVGAVSADTLNGGDGADVLNGADGNDVINGGADDDTIDGGADDDTIDGGAGIDSATYASAAIGVTVDLTSVGAQATGAGSDTLIGIENLVGSAFGDTLLGDAGANRLGGGAGDDILRGGDGIDTLDGGLGADQMSGGGGDDGYIVDNAGDQVIELAGQGNDTVQSAVSYTLGSDIEALTLTGSAEITGVGNTLANAITGNGAGNVLSGLAGNDTIAGGGGNDSVDGGTGADAMIGGAGNDTYTVDDAGDVVTEATGEGSDQVRSRIDYVLGANVEELTLIGAARAGTGNELDNVIRGTVGGDVLSGLDGNDSLIGGDGNDMLDGAAGNDVLTGAMGRDTMTGGTGADRFTFSEGATSSDRQFADRILDFSHTDGDKIVLSGIDADTNLANDQAFAFIGAAAFGNVAGELRVQVANAFTYAEGDVNGDGVADFSIRLNGTVALVAGDFVL